MSIRTDNPTRLLERDIDDIIRDDARTENTMNAKHTQGPWDAYHGEQNGLEIGDWMICDKDKEEVAIVRFNAADSMDNARLIAAAPELLAALEDLRKQIREHFRLDVKKHYSLMVADAAAGTALAKARGE